LGVCGIDVVFRGTNEVGAYTVHLSAPFLELSIGEVESIGVDVIDSGDIFWFGSNQGWSDCHVFKEVEGA
jgi:hypothetical protein